MASANTPHSGKPKATSLRYFIITYTKLAALTSRKIFWRGYMLLWPKIAQHYRICLFVGFGRYLCCLTCLFSRIWELDATLSQSVKLHEICKKALTVAMDIPLEEPRLAQKRRGPTLNKSA